jgi:hypothetical protein
MPVALCVFIYVTYTGLLKGVYDVLIALTEINNKKQFHNIAHF